MKFSVQKHVMSFNLILWLRVDMYAASCIMLLGLLAYVFCVPTLDETFLSEVDPIHVFLFSYRTPQEYKKILNIVYKWNI